MRLNLYWRGWDVLDVEDHLWRRRPSDSHEDDVIVTSIADLPGAELAEDYEPETYVRSLPFGFQA